MIHGSVTRHQGTMNDKESREAFVEGALKASSAAREMAKEYADPEWEETAAMLDGMRVNGVKLFGMQAMSRIETMMAANIKTGQILLNGK